MKLLSSILFSIFSKNSKVTIDNINLNYKFNTTMIPSSVYNVTSKLILGSISSYNIYNKELLNIKIYNEYNSNIFYNDKELNNIEIINNFNSRGYIKHLNNINTTDYSYGLYHINGNISGNIDSSSNFFNIQLINNIEINDSNDIKLNIPDLNWYCIDIKCNDIKLQEKYNGTININKNNDKNTSIFSELSNIDTYINITNDALTGITKIDNCKQINLKLGEFFAGPFIIDKINNTFINDNDTKITEIKDCYNSILENVNTINGNLYNCKLHINNNITPETIYNTKDPLTIWSKLASAYNNSIYYHTHYRINPIIFNKS